MPLKDRKALTSKGVRMMMDAAITKAEGQTHNEER